MGVKTFVYSAVDINKIVTIFFSKNAFIHYAQLITLQNYSLLHLPITDERFKLNFNSVK